VHVESTSFCASAPSCAPFRARSRLRKRLDAYLTIGSASPVRRSGPRSGAVCPGFGSSPPSIKMFSGPPEVNRNSILAACRPTLRNRWCTVRGRNTTCPGPATAGNGQLGTHGRQKTGTLVWFPPVQQNR
jgi:hypothetical protein